MFASGLALVIIGYGILYMGMSHFGISWLNNGNTMKFFDVWGIKTS